MEGTNNELEGYTSDKLNRYSGDGDGGNGNGGGRPLSSTQPVAINNPKGTSENEIYNRLSSISE